MRILSYNNPVDLDAGEYIIVEKSQYDKQQAALKVARDGLEYILNVADAQYENDTALKHRGARTLRRIADKAEQAIQQIDEALNDRT